MRHRTKLLYRILSMSLAALMVFTSAPIPAFAEETGTAFVSKTYF